MNLRKIILQNKKVRKNILENNEEKKISKNNGEKIIPKK